MLAGRDSDTITGAKDLDPIDRKVLKTYSTQLPSTNSSSNLFARGSSGGGQGSPTNGGGGRSTSVETGTNGTSPKHQTLQQQGSQGRGLGSPTSQSLVISSSPNRTKNQTEDQES